MRTILRLTFAAALTAAFSMAGNTDDKLEARPQVEVVAHRGASAVAPENTLAAFELARELGADWFELDCSLCKSGEVVVMHDNSVDRTTDGKGKLADLTLDEIKKLDAGSWKDAKYAGERVPTLKQALEICGPEIGCYVEIKQAGTDMALGDLLGTLGKDRLGRDAEFDKAFIEAVSDSPNAKLARAVIRVIGDEKKEASVVVQSFSPIVCGVVAIEAPELKVELLGGGRSAESWEGYYRWLLLFDFDGVNTSKEALTEGRLDVLRSAGKSCAVYTVDGADDIKRLAGWGVNRIITNKPDLCLDELKKLGKH